jgi:hypothetical protein
VRFWPRWGGLYGSYSFGWGVGRGRLLLPIGDEVGAPAGSYEGIELLESENCKGCEDLGGGAGVEGNSGSSSDSSTGTGVEALPG